MDGHCHCGAVKISIAQKPDFLNDCNCSLCKKSGVLWGYFETKDVVVTGATHFYTRTDKDNAVIEKHFCPQCGCTTHWDLTDEFRKANPDIIRMGVNMNLFNPELLQGIELRFPDGKAWEGEGDYSYVRDAVKFGE